MNAAARCGFADARSVRRAVDVNVAACESTLPPRLKPGSSPSSHKMRVVILASANSGCDVWPTALRDLKTVPAGASAPIFSTMRCNPSGVRFEPSACPMPKREVEHWNCFTNRQSFGVPASAGSGRLKAELRTCSNSETVCPATLVMTTKRVEAICHCRQAFKNPAGIFTPASYSCRANCFRLNGKSSEKIHPVPVMTVQFNRWNCC